MTDGHGHGQDEQLQALAVLALRIALRRLRWEEAEEITQAAVAAFLLRREYVCNPEAYVTRVTCNVVAKLGRQQRRCVPSAETVEVADRTQEDPFDRVLNRILAEVIFEEVSPVLTDRESQVLKLQHVEGLSRKQVAEQLGGDGGDS
jgi:RNA polymerase sigma factor (sigma-70 family)